MEAQTKLIERLKELVAMKCNHKPNCWLKQDWTEARMAMADTPNEFKDEGYLMALEEIEHKSHACNCGYDELIDEIASLDKQIAEGKEIPARAEAELLKLFRDIRLQFKLYDFVSHSDDYYKPLIIKVKEAMQRQ